MSGITLNDVDWKLMNLTIAFIVSILAVRCEYVEPNTNLLNIKLFKPIKNLFVSKDRMAVMQFF